MTRSSAVQRYKMTVAGLSAAYAGALIGVGTLFRAHPPTGPAAYLLAILPALPIIGIFAAIGRYLVEERDEYLRLLMVRQSLVASGFSLSVATAWGFLESFGMIGHLPAYWFAVLWFAGLGLGSCVNKLTLGRQS